MARLISKIIGLALLSIFQGILAFLLTTVIFGFAAWFAVLLLGAEPPRNFVLIGGILVGSAWAIGAFTYFLGALVKQKYDAYTEEKIRKIMNE